MSDPILEKLDLEWASAIEKHDYVTGGKILRAKINVLKSVSSLSEHKKDLASWVSLLQDQLAALPVETSLTVIGHLRHARKALSLTSSDVGSAFRTEISRAERKRFRQRNRPPSLGIPDRSDLPAGYANGSPSLHLQSGDLGDADSE